ncbi:MAG: hypothetical protein VSS75_009920 [Candidatus Parabeggiatoa sp.]|nr:hypothetical protein [Candidatus Parabeggiatoa sp.]
MGKQTTKPWIFTSSFCPLVHRKSIPPLVCMDYRKANQYVSPHPVYLSLGKDSKSRQAAYRGLFQSELDFDAINDIRQALTQNQPLGNSRFYTNIE